MKDMVVEMLASRGVRLEQIAQIVVELQRPYRPDLTVDECLRSVEKVMEKREVQHAVLTGIALDMLAESDALPEPLLTLVKTDDPLYGVDEILALSITNIYGTVGLTNFGYVDKRKMGVLRVLNTHSGKSGTKVNTFLDDLVAGIAGAAAARIAHRGEAAG
ncbi:MAG: phosphatidylglycerophosphatase A [Firmicutes bacterium]|nr:phosphatidylglycerophosphatase A [Bacillota bacterium]